MSDIIAETEAHNPELVARLIETYRSFTTHQLQEDVRLAEIELHRANVALANGTMPRWVYAEVNYPGEAHLAKLTLALRLAGRL